MEELSDNYVNLEGQYLSSDNTFDRVETKVSWLTLTNEHTVSVLENGVGRDDVFDFKLFDPVEAIGGRYKSYKFVVESCQPLENDRRAFVVASLCSSKLLTREFMIVEPSVSSRPGEVSYVAFRSVQAGKELEIRAKEIEEFYEGKVVDLQGDYL